jgi:hypothetical protein
MEWEPENVARERPALQAMASHKYDEYQQFAPGMRFIESLAVWLNRFVDLDQRRGALEFVKERLVFCSDAEMRHLVEVAYPDHIRPVLMRQVAEELDIESWKVSEILSTVEYQLLRRRSLYIGLSDGSRIDVFRRANNVELSHEQIVLIYDSLGDKERVDSVLSKLNEDVVRITDEGSAESRFSNLVLMDDFSGSGFSYIRESEDGGHTGKIAKLCETIFERKGQAARLVDPGDFRVILVLYVATSRARAYLAEKLRTILEPEGVSSEVIVVQLIEEDVVIHPGQNTPLDALLDAYYNREFEDRHSAVGGKSVKYGFADCGLPLVLSHNTPNNSLYILWVEKEGFRGLFPRRSRHGGTD